MPVESPKRTISIVALCFAAAWLADDALCAPSSPDHPTEFSPAFDAAREQFQTFAAHDEQIRSTASPRRRAELQRELPHLLDKTVASINRAILRFGQHESAPAEPIDFQRVRELETATQSGVRLGPDDQGYLEFARDLQRLHQLRYLLTYVYLRQQRYYESAILGEFVADKHDPADPIALNSAQLALSASQQAWNAEPADHRDAESRLVTRIAERIDRTWPESAVANDARLSHARLLQKSGHHAKAAEWFDRVPRDSNLFADAQLGAGQAFWSAYLAAVTATEPESSPTVGVASQPEQLLDAADQRLKAGLRMTMAVLLKINFDDQPATAPLALVSGRVALAQVNIFQHDYAAAIELIRKKPWSVLDAIAVDDETERPATGVQSGEFAALVWQILLRAHVGQRQVADAEQAMDKLESIAGRNDSQRLATIYVQLGQQLQAQATSVKNNPVRSAELRQALETFLRSVDKRSTSLGTGPLLWLAETWNTIGESTPNDHMATDCFRRAADAWQIVSDRSSTRLTGTHESGLSQAQRWAILVRLARARARHDAFDRALATISIVLQHNPKALDVQFAAAEILQQWGSQTAGDVEHLRLAIHGLQHNGIDIWGWARTAERIARSLAASELSASAETPDQPAEPGTSATLHIQRRAQFEDQLLQARFHQATCRYQIARLLKEPNDRTTELDKARLELLSFAAVSRTADSPWWTRLEQLYQQILEDLGHTSTPLRRNG